MDSNGSGSEYGGSQNVDRLRDEQINALRSELRKLKHLDTDQQSSRPRLLEAASNVGAEGVKEILHVFLLIDDRLGQSVETLIQTVLSVDQTSLGGRRAVAIPPGPR